MQDLLARPVLPHAGKVWLIGAGPGAIDLITVRGAALLGQAEVVLHDALVTSEILGLCSQAHLVSVGKRSGQRSTAQTVINQQLIAQVFTILKTALGAGSLAPYLVNGPSSSRTRCHKSRVTNQQPRARTAAGARTF